MPDMVANPLTLVMDVNPQNYQQLKATLEDMQGQPTEGNPIVAALNGIGTVHFARFVFIGTDKLAVITAYDGEFDDYINAFVDKIGAVFDAILEHILDAPPLPVADHREEFLQYVEDHDLTCIQPFYSAYPELKVLDILTLQHEQGQ